ncbi:Uracil permease [Bacillus sp. JJ634]
MSQCPKKDGSQQPICPVPSRQQGRLNDTPVTTVLQPGTPTLKVPVVLAERTLQIVIEADIPLRPAAAEIKRVHKDVFLDQVKLVPVAFAPIPGTSFFNVTRAKLFVSGFIRKNIEYASALCNGLIHDRVAEVPFTGFAELTADEFFNLPIFAASADARAQFLNDKSGLAPRLDKFFFQNAVNYNEQPFGELIRAEFFELDFSPVKVGLQRGFSTLREKIVMDLTLKVLQVQQVEVTGSVVIPTSPGTIIG